jgi:hypothetical protein
MPLDEVKPYLNKLGTCIQAFNQDTAWAKLPEAMRNRFAASGKDSPAAGFCKGAAIDWIRRVLLRVASLKPEEKRPGEVTAEEAEKIKAEMEAFNRRMNEIRSLPGGDQKATRVERMAVTWAAAAKVESNFYKIR